MPGVLADYVTLDQGTGIVHTAPGHGADDFRTGQKYGLEAYAPQDDDGRFVEGLPEYKGKTVFEANPIVIELLKKRGMLVGEKKLTHSYPHCWRCHNPVIFRATEQWFIGLDQDNLRQTALEEIDKVKWIPAWGQDRMRRNDRRPPGLVHFAPAILGRAADHFLLRRVREAARRFARRCATSCHFSSAKAPTPGTRTPPRSCCRPERSAPCGERKWRKENDILDVWFDSGSTHLAVLSEKDGTWPADVYLEGPDQFRGWFHSSLLVGVGTRGRAPYRQVVTHGWTLDETGEPMSKSLGNAVYPNEISRKVGRRFAAPVGRLAGLHRGHAHTRAAMMTQLAEAYRKIRNTFRFALSNLFDFDPARDAVPDADLWEMDAWMLRAHRRARRTCAASGTRSSSFIACITRFTISARWI